MPSRAVVSSTCRICRRSGLAGTPEALASGGVQGGGTPLGRLAIIRTLAVMPVWIRGWQIFGLS
eukprot:5362304-Alexandrium_andersonii.AAC.1